MDCTIVYFLFIKNLADVCYKPLLKKWLVLASGFNFIFRTLFSSCSSRR